MTQPLSAVAIAMVLAASVAVASSAARPQSPGAAATGTQEQRVTLAFDLPPDTGGGRGGASPAIVGFQIGYFRPGPTGTPLKTVDIGRAAVTFQGNSARLTLVPDGLPEGDNTVVLRVRSRSLGQFSDWSEPTGVITVPALPARSGTPAVPNNDRATNQRQQQRRGLAAADLDEYPALKAAIQPLLTPGLSLDDVAGSFSGVDDLAAAVAASRQNKLPFADLRKTIAGPPPRSLRAALRTLQPSINVRDALRKARDEGRTLAARSKAPQ